MLYQPIDHCQTEPKVYRRPPIRGIIVILFGFVYTGIGLVTIDAIGYEAWWWVMILGIFGAVLMWGGFAILCTRLTVDDWGITSSYGFGVDFSASWEDIESWSMILLHGERTVKFQIRGYRWPRYISEDEAWRPRFHELLEDIRVYAKGKEQPAQ